MPLVNEALEAAIARPRRSMLYMPGANARALEKAKTLPADSLILDLEDAVAPDAKEAARKQVIAAVKGGGYGRRELVIRMNSLDTGWGHEDVLALANAGAHAILIAKVESGEQVRHVEALLEEYKAPPDLALMAMIETPMGVLNAAEIARATPRMICLVMGTSDLTKDLHAAHTKERLPMLTSLGLCLLAARANRIAIVDGVHLDLADDEGFAYSCQQGRELGFDGKTLIHPSQIETCNATFAPTEEEITRARAVIEAFALPENAGKGVIKVDGRMTELLHLEEAKRVVAVAEAIGSKLLD